MVSLPPRGGFTLVEVLIVVILLALGAALAPPNLRSRGGPGPRSAADSLALLLTATRAVAIEKSAPATLVLDPSAESWWRLAAGNAVDGGRWPSSIIGLPSTDRVSISFSPTGEAWPPARLRVLAKGDTTTVVVDPWTGRVRIE